MIDLTKFYARPWNEHIGACFIAASILSILAQLAGVHFETSILGCFASIAFGAWLIRPERYALFIGAVNVLLLVDMFTRAEPYGALDKALIAFGIAGYPIVIAMQRRYGRMVLGT